VVLTTMDPASYLDAYNFIKVGLLRRLNRIFGPESPYRREKDEQLAEIINSFVANAGKGRRVEALLDEVAATRPQGLELLRRVVGSYRPRTVINMPAGDNDVDALAERLCKVSARMLSIDIAYLGQLAYDETIHQCTQNLVPHVTRHPEGSLGQFCRLLMADIEHSQVVAEPSVHSTPLALTA
jgi:flagellar biosynthesis protein FlhG